MGQGTRAKAGLKPAYPQGLKPRGLRRVVFLSGVPKPAVETTTPGHHGPGEHVSEAVV